MIIWYTLTDDIHVDEEYGRLKWIWKNMEALKAPSKGFLFLGIDDPLNLLFDSLNLHSSFLNKEISFSNSKVKYT